jgi:hypothetical protein
MRHGILGCEAMGLNRTFHNPPFGVFSYEATRGLWKEGQGHFFSLLFPENASKAEPAEP